MTDFSRLYDMPDALSRMSMPELYQLAEDIRAFLVQNVSKTGGHLASNLGVVELTIALHCVFSFPEDKLIWDVGHQSYVHKILTGRASQFPTLRKFGGLSGFPKTSESAYDCFNTGHSSTSVSAALGMDARNSSEIGICAKAFSMDSVKRAAAFPVGATNLM